MFHVTRALQAHLNALVWCTRSAHKVLYRALRNPRNLIICGSLMHRLPNAPIAPVGLADVSGTTSLFGVYASRSQNWTLGTSTSLVWPRCVRRTSGGSNAVLQAVNGTANAIGWVHRFLLIAWEDAFCHWESTEVHFRREALQQIQRSSAANVAIPFFIES